MAGNDREMISKNFVNIPDTLQQRLLLTTIAKIAKMTRFESSNQNRKYISFFQEQKQLYPRKTKAYTLLTH